jgi:hypothetical protein
MQQNLPIKNPKSTNFCQPLASVHCTALHCTALDPEVWTNRLFEDCHLDCKRSSSRTRFGALLGNLQTAARVPLPALAGRSGQRNGMMSFKILQSLMRRLFTALWGLPVLNGRKVSEFKPN